MKIPTPFLLALSALALCGCQSSTVESRRQERMSAYTELSPEMKQMVDGGQIRVGMSMDAVYIAWGKPAQVTESETSAGHLITWQYQGTYLQETRFWNYREVSRDGVTYLDRVLDHSYDPRQYVRAEITFEQGRVKSWRTLGAPPQ